MIKLRTSVHAGVIGERWRDSLKSQQQSKTSISQTKQQGALAELVKENLLTRGYERGGECIISGFVPPLAGWLGGGGGWEGGQILLGCQMGSLGHEPDPNAPAFMQTYPPSLL